MTYRNCKKLIENAEKRGTKTAEFISDMADKLDIFLLDSRVTDAKYYELAGMLNCAE